MNEFIRFCVVDVQCRLKLCHKSEKNLVPVSNEGSKEEEPVVAFLSR